MVAAARHRACRDLLARPDRTSSECRCQIAPSIKRDLGFSQQDAY